MAVPRTSSTNVFCQSGRIELRMNPPKPSTVPIRVRSEMIGSGAPTSIRYRAWATFG